MTPLQVLTRALFHFDSESGGATLDSSLSQRQIALASAHSISTARSKFGGASLFASATGSSTQVSLGRAYSRFSFDTWFFAETNNVSRAVTTLLGACELYVRGSTQKLALYDGSSVRLDGTTTVTTNTWHHVAWSFDGTTHRVFLDGVLQGSAAFGSSYGFTMHVGSYDNGTDMWLGNFDEMRLVEDVLYTTDFTPPTAPYDDIPKSLLNAKLADAPLRLLGAAPTATNFKLAQHPMLLRDRIDGGFGQIVGTVKEKSTPTNVPLRRKVRLFHELSGRFLRETWSDDAGNYAFTGIDPTQRYTVVSYDYLQNYRAVIADNILPEVMA